MQPNCFLLPPSIHPCEWTLRFCLHVGLGGGGGENRQLSCDFTDSQPSTELERQPYEGLHILSCSCPATVCNACDFGMVKQNFRRLKQAIQHHLRLLRLLHTYKGTMKHAHFCTYCTTKMHSTLLPCVLVRKRMYVSKVQGGAIKNQWHHSIFSKGLCVLVYCENTSNFKQVLAMHKYYPSVREGRS